MHTFKLESKCITAYSLLDPLPPPLYAFRLTENMLLTNTYTSFIENLVQITSAASQGHTREEFWRKLSTGPIHQRCTRYNSPLSFWKGESIQ